MIGLSFLWWLSFAWFVLIVVLDADNIKPFLILAALIGCAIFVDPNINLF